MAKSIQTTGNLRDFLANMLVGLKDGNIKPDVAAKLTKMASVMNESLYAELKSARVLVDLKRPVPALGDMKIGGTDK